MKVKIIVYQGKVIYHCKEEHLNFIQKQTEIQLYTNYMQIDAQ